MNICLTGGAVSVTCLIVGGTICKAFTGLRGKYTDIFAYLDMVRDSDAEKFAIINHIIKNAKMSRGVYITPTNPKVDAKAIVLIQKDFTLSKRHWLERVPYPNGAIVFVISPYFYKGFLKHNRKTGRNKK